MIQFQLKHPQATQEMLGYLPLFWDVGNPESAREQVNHNYTHGGGWNPLKGWKITPSGQIEYPGDEPLRLIAEAQLRDETIRLYEYAWVCIIQKDGTYEVARMD